MHGWKVIRSERTVVRDTSDRTTVSIVGPGIEEQWSASVGVARVLVGQSCGETAGSPGNTESEYRATDIERKYASHA